MYSFWDEGVKASSKQCKHLIVLHDAHSYVLGVAEYVPPWRARRLLPPPLWLQFTAIFNH